MDLVESIAVSRAVHNTACLVLKCGVISDGTSMWCGNPVYFRGKPSEPTQLQSYATKLQRVHGLHGAAVASRVPAQAFWARGARPPLVRVHTAHDAGGFSRGIPCGRRGPQQLLRAVSKLPRVPSGTTLSGVPSCPGSPAPVGPGSPASSWCWPVDVVELALLVGVLAWGRLPRRPAAERPAPFAAAAVSDSEVAASRAETQRQIRSRALTVA